VSDDTQFPTNDGKGINLAEVLPSSPQIPPSEASNLHLLTAIRDLITQFLAGTMSQRLDPESGRPVHGPCTRCGYVWMGRNGTDSPIQCPRCHSSAWRKFPRVRYQSVAADNEVRESAAKAAGVAPKAAARKADPAAAPRDVYSSTLTPAQMAVVAASPVDAYFPPLPRRDAIGNLTTTPWAPPPVQLPPPPPPVIVMPRQIPSPRPITREDVAEVRDAMVESARELNESHSIREEPVTTPPANIDSMTKEEVMDLVRTPTTAQQVREFIAQQEPPTLSPPSDATDAFFKPTEDAKRAFFADPIDLTPRIRAVDDGTPPPAPIPDDKVIVNTANLDAVMAKLGKK
jgi:hypothetical protein